MNTTGMAERNYERGYINPEHVQLYEHYVNLLKKTNDAALDDVRSKLILNDLRHSIVRIREGARNFVDQMNNPGAKWVFTKDILKGITDFFAMLIATLIYIIPTWAIALFVSWAVLAFAGDNKTKFLKPQPVHRFKNRWLNRAYWMVFCLGKEICYFLFQLVYRPAKNYLSTFSEKSSPSYRIGAGLFTIAITLLVSNVAAMVAQKY